MKIIIFFLFTIFFIIVTNASPEQPVVDAPVGKIRGSILTTRLGKRIYSFRGIRYAEPPTGFHRFQPPIPAKDWKDVFDASEEGPSCPQPDAIQGSEDCLRLNIYTTKLPSRTENVSRPVMIFIHPSGYYLLSGQSLYFGPQYILDYDIVLVTINYRLGSLGFLSTGDNLAPGNMGLKDQVVALRWVQRNIATFGGNPNSVTLYGYSSGSSSIMLHMVSPMSQNLFHRAIASSFSAIGADVYSFTSQNGQKNLADRQARLIGCPTDTTEAMLRCMRTKSIESFTNTTNSMFDWKGTPVPLWLPTVEPESCNDRFLTAQPYDLIAQGKFHQVPLILGVTQDEIGGVVVSYEKDKNDGNGSDYSELDENWDTLAPILFMYERNTPHSRYLSRELRKFYFKDQPLSANRQAFADIFADAAVIFPMYRAAKIFATYSKFPIYFYKFTYVGRYSLEMWNATTPYGVAHMDDLQYLFYMKQWFPYFNSTAPEIPMVEIYTAMWSNFVENGEPIPRNNERLKDVQWDKFVSTRNNFLDINPHPIMKTKFFPERMREWEKLFPLPSSRGRN